MIPEKQFEAAQHDSGFKAWLKMMPYVVEDFLTFNMSGMSDDPYSVEGLRKAEAAALKRFANYHTVFDKANRDDADKFIRFLGQAFVEAFGGQWVNLPADKEAGELAQVAVRLPFRKDGYVTPVTLLTTAVHRRTGQVWSKVFQSAMEEAVKK